MLKSILNELLKEAQLNLDTVQIDQLVALVELLDKWNKAYNLTSVRDPKEMLIRHILDSLESVNTLEDNDLSMLELGQGCRDFL